MTEFITRNYGNKEFEVIVKTDNKEHYKQTEDLSRKLIGHAKPVTDNNVGDKLTQTDKDTNVLTNADRCVCCGEIIPEGRQVCPNCFADAPKEMPYLIDRNSLIDRLKKCQAETTGITRATILQIIDIVKEMPNRGVNDG